jgi:DNA helicase HerA-like ATPase
MEPLEPTDAQMELQRKDLHWRMSSDRAAMARIYGKARVTPLTADQKLLLRHVLIVGATGSGKTNHAFELIKAAVPFGNVVVVDVKREYRDLAKSMGDVRVLSVGGEPRVEFNPLVPPKGVDSEHWDRAFADVFTRAYGLSEPSRRIVLDSLSFLRRDEKEDPTLRELEKQVAKFDAGSAKEQSSQRSLESRLHIINTGPVGKSLIAENGLDVDSFDHGVTVFEIDEVDSLRDQRFLTELLLLYLWQHDRHTPVEEEERLRRLIVVEEAHRYLSEERPPEQRGDRTLLELAIAEARRYGWGFLIIDQMPLLLSRYVWDNVGTVFVHRLTNVDSFRAASKVFSEDPLGVGPWDDTKMVSIALRLPEGLALYKRYVDYGLEVVPVTGVVAVPKVR